MENWKNNYAELEEPVPIRTTYEEYEEGKWREELLEKEMSYEKKGYIQ